MRWKVPGFKELFDKNPDIPSEPELSFSQSHMNFRHAETSRMKLLYGLDRLPAGISIADERLPNVVVGPAPLRLNSVPLPDAFFPVGESSQSARSAAVQAWLEAACGPYAPHRRRFVALYLAFAAAHLNRHRDELSKRLHRFDGLYRIEDFLWSALRPLPRAWVPVGDKWTFVDFAFWDGRQLTALMIGEERIGPDDVFHAAGFALCRISASSLIGEPEVVIQRCCPGTFLRFWEGEILPQSPFRRYPVIVTAAPPGKSGG
jgi:hypothetical protein